MIRQLRHLSALDQNHYLQNCFLSCHSLDTITNVGNKVYGSAMNYPSDLKKTLNGSRDFGPTPALGDDFSFLRIIKAESDVVV